MKPSNIGLIGFGSWAREAYVPALIGDPNIEIVAISARTSETHDKAQNFMGKQLDCYTDYVDMLARSDIDAVMIGIPPEASPEAALAAVNAHKHVFVEPPFQQSAMTEHMLQTASHSTNVFHVNMEGRYIPVLDNILSLTNRDDFGTLSSIEISLSSNWANNWGKHNPRLVIGLSTWYIDLINYMAHGQPQMVQTVGAREKIGKAILYYRNNLQGLWHFNLRTDGDLSLIINVSGEYGQVDANLLSGEYRWNVANISGSNKSPAEQTLGFVGVRESVNSFLSAIRGQGETRTGAKEYAEIHKIIEGLNRSFQHGIQVGI